MPCLFRPARHDPPIPRTIIYFTNTGLTIPSPSSCASRDPASPRTGFVSVSHLEVEQQVRDGLERFVAVGISFCSYLS